MWGICYDVDMFDGKLYQMIIEYIVKDNKVIVISPIDNIVPDISKVRELPTPPGFLYGGTVSPVNHLDMKGKIHTIRWHYNSQAYYYYIQVDGKNKSKRYFEEDLVGAE